MDKPNPTEQIVQMRQQGMSNNQIIQQLQQQGFSSHEIFEALNMADMKQSYQAPTQAPPVQEAQNPMQMQPQSVLGTPPQQFQPPQGMPPPMQQESPDDVEELIKAVIEEKWGELKKSVDKVIAWKEQMEEKIAKMSQQMDSMKGDFDKLHQAVIGKIGEYDKNILEVGTQLNAMEKVFSKVLPTFTENVNELTRITDKFKGQ